MSVKVKRLCETCGAEFYRYPSDIKHGAGRYCSLKCMGEARSKRTGTLNPKYIEESHIKRICEICGVVFYKPRTVIKKGHGRFCSVKCRVSWMATRRGPLSPKYNRIKRRCLECNGDLEVTPSQISSGHGLFCSKECKYKHKTRELVKHHCLECNGEFEAKPFMNRQFCSHSCFTKHNSGDRNVNWSGGTSYGKYCKKFNNEFRERVRVFWRYQCGNCGKPQEKNDRKLHVHHVNYQKDACCNNQIRPLFIPLCTVCHLKTNLNRKEWEEKFTEIIESRFGGKCYCSPGIV